jgi:hypothetical protein
MDEGLSRRPIAVRCAPLCVLLACACALASFGVAQASAVGTAVGGSSASQVTSPTSSGGVSATLEECVTAVAQSERAATFSGEMTAIPGTVRMAMRIDVEERVPGEATFHAVTASGLGVWRSADPKVKVYKYLKQVTNLFSPASYRGFVQFRWIGDKGHTIKRAERMTTRCLQPAPPVETTGPEGSSPPSVGNGAPGATG